VRLIVSGLRSDLVKELREIADTIESDGAAESMWGMNSLRTPDIDLVIAWSEFQESSNDAILYTPLSISEEEYMAAG